MSIKITVTYILTIVFFRVNIIPNYKFMHVNIRSMLGLSPTIF